MREQIPAHTLSKYIFNRFQYYTTQKGLHIITINTHFDFSQNSALKMLQSSSM